VGRQQQHRSKVRMSRQMLRHTNVILPILSQIIVSWLSAGAAEYDLCLVGKEQASRH
jgi:hypothetical protein